MAIKALIVNPVGSGTELNVVISEENLEKFKNTLKILCNVKDITEQNPSIADLCEGKFNSETTHYLNTEMSEAKALKELAETNNESYPYGQRYAEEDSDGTFYYQYFFNGGYRRVGVLG